MDTDEGQAAVGHAPGPEHVVVGIAFVSNPLTDESQHHDRHYFRTVIRT
ncbi:hypothetical protein ACFXHD_02440 [Streptomyces hydrogenans]